MANRLSIITINLNNADGLDKTLKSVVNQTYLSFELIVIDGASSDSSVGVIRNYENKLAYWISEKDSGIYNAMNKGIRQATGEYCLFLNSGDWLVDTRVLENVFSTNPHADIISGDIYFYDSQLSQVKWLVPSPIT